MKVLDEVRHRYIIQNMVEVSSVANLDKRYIEESMIGSVKDSDVEWVRNYPTLPEDKHGLVIVGSTEATKRMMYMCGALVRNYVDARVYPVHSLLPSKNGGEALFDGTEATVLFIPNFYVQTHGGKSFTAWQLSLIYDVLMQRKVSGKKTVLYVEDTDRMTIDYGESFFGLLDSYEWVY